MNSVLTGHCWPSALRVLVLLLMTSMPALAQDLLSERSAPGQSDPVQYLEDPDAGLAITAVLEKQGWQSLDGGFNQGYSNSVWWLKIPLRNSAPDELTRYLEIGYPVLDSIEVFVVSEGQVLAQHSLGNKLPFANRLVSHQNFVIPVQLPAHSGHTLYLRLQSETMVQAPMDLWSREQFLEANYDRLFTRGIFFGALVLIAAYNLLLAFGLREKSYLYYVGYVMSMAVFLASMDGLTFRFLWPHATYWNDQIIVASLAGLTMFAGLFARNLLDIPRFSRSLDIVTRIHILLAFLLLVSNVAFPYETGVKLGILATLSGSAISLWAGPSAWFHKQPAGKYYTYAWTLLFACGLLHFLGRINVFDAPALTNHILSIGVIGEVLILSLALGERINSERQQRMLAEQGALEAEGTATAELEQRVAQRNAELASLNARLKVLSQTDQLTALPNRHTFEIHLKQEFKRCRRTKSPLSVALLDIDHFKGVNDQWGHQAGDECLQAVALRLQEATARAGQMAARYGGEEFCLLLPEVDAVEAHRIAERLRCEIEKIAITGAGNSFSITVSIGTATTVPEAGKSAEHLLRGADLAMYHAKDSGRNQVHSASVPWQKSPG